MYTGKVVEPPPATIKVMIKSSIEITKASIKPDKIPGVSKGNVIVLNAEVLFEEMPDQVGPFGARGAGESPIAAGISAVCQAVFNATGFWIDMPMTPERVYKAMHKL